MHFKVTEPSAAVHLCGWKNPTGEDRNEPDKREEGNDRKEKRIAARYRGVIKGGMSKSKKDIQDVCRM